ncbi:hypothetical protein BBP40_007958 [Aspergillus hancockii]|nr:hypothetical protein BBP40_007958 [Aspergillus hancockii]
MTSSGSSLRIHQASYIRDTELLLEALDEWLQVKSLTILTLLPTLMAGVLAAPEHKLMCPLLTAILLMKKPRLFEVVFFGQSNPGH